MKYLIVSDIHGSMYYTNKIKSLIKKENPDKVILLGDLYYHGPRNPLPKEYNPKMVCEYFNSIKKNLITIKGNCDAEVDEMISDFKLKKSYSFLHNDKVVFLTHGHKHNKDNFPKTDFDIMFYGHFHIGFIGNVDGKIIANPGSISLPKNNAPNSYIVMDDKSIILKDLKGNILNEQEINK